MMMRPRHLLVAAMFLGLGACSALRPDTPMDRDAGHRLDRGLSALEAGSYRQAFDDLAWVYTQCQGHERSAQALVAMAALELDPRNRAARPGVATDLLGRVIREPTAPDYVRPLANSAYLMARTLGAPAATVAATPGDSGAAPAAARVDTARAAAPAVDVVRAAEVLDQVADEPAFGCGAAIVEEGWVAPRLPELPGPSLVSLLTAAERSREASAAETERLRGELAAVQERLAATEAELERIRKTLRP